MPRGCTLPWGCTSAFLFLRINSTTAVAIAPSRAAPNTPPTVPPTTPDLSFGHDESTEEEEEEEEEEEQDVVSAEVSGVPKAVTVVDLYDVAVGNRDASRKLPMSRSVSS